MGGKVTINGNTTVTATFTQDEYTLDVTIVGQGTVAKEPDQTTYHQGDVVTLTAAAADGWSFGSWSANVVGGKVTINGNTTVTATFTQDEYTLTVNSAHGLVDVSELGPYHYGDNVTLMMGTVDPGLTFTNWDGAGCLGTDPCAITIHGNTEVTANFTENEYALTINQSTGGLITANPALPYHLNEVVTLTATANPGYTFFAWTGDCSSETTATCTLTMNAAKSVSADLHTKSLHSGCHL